MWSSNKTSLVLVLVINNARFEKKQKTFKYGLILKHRQQTLSDVRHSSNPAPHHTQCLITSNYFQDDHKVVCLRVSNSCV